ncbi:MAG TPA: divalent metal cation transporter [Ktedonobacterales bacterium]|nr:divalent metal cation transporter [Ktedonobacterales bacterium]
MGRKPTSASTAASAEPSGDGVEAGHTDRRRRLASTLGKHRGRARFLHAPRFLRVLGPGLITGAADDDPSGIGTYSQTGAAFGSELLWTALYLLPLMIFTQEMCGRIGLVTRQGLAGLIRSHYSRKLLIGSVALLFIANTINVGADLGAMTASVQLLLPHAPTAPLLIAIAVGVLLLEIFVPYRLYAQALKVLALSLLAYVITGFIIGGDWRVLLLNTLIPHVEFTSTYLTLLVALIGTTISPYLFFWQASEEVEEENKRKHIRTARDIWRKRALKLKLKRLRADTILGMVAAGATFWFIIQTTAGTLHVHNITTIQTAAQAAEALEPFAHGLPYAGTIARALFALGVVGTGLLAVPVLAGSAAYGVAEAFGWHEGLSKVFTQARGFYAVIAASTLIGLALNFVGIDPITALVYAAVINAIVAVPLLALVLRVANNRAIMGEFVNNRLSNVVGLITLTFMAVAAVVVIIALL